MRTNLGPVLEAKVRSWPTRYAMCAFHTHRHPRPVGQPSHRMRLRMDVSEGLSGGRRLRGPAEWLTRTPDAVHDHRELTGKRYACLACT